MTIARQYGSIVSLVGQGGAEESVVIQTLSAFSELRAHHLTLLAAEEQAILLLRAEGLTPVEIAELLFKHPRTIRAQLEKLEELICIPLGRRKDVGLACGWVVLHVGCSSGCLAEGILHLQENGVLS